MKKDVYLVPARVVGEPFLSRIVAFQKEWRRVMAIYSEFSEKHGGERMFVWRTLNGLKFPWDAKFAWSDGKTYRWPEGWTKPKGRNEFSAPKKKTAAYEEMQALPKMPSPYDVYGDEIILQSSYTFPEGSGGGVLINGTDPVIEWTGGEPDAYFMEIPDIEAFLKINAVAQPDYVYSDAMRAWRWPAGLQKMTAAERELEFAKAKVEQERRDAAEAA